MLFDINNILKFLCNYIFVSLPQGVISIAIALFLLKEYKYFEKSKVKQTILDIVFMAGIQSAFLTNYLFYFTNINLFLRLLLNLLIGTLFVNIFIYFTQRRENWEKYLEHLKGYVTIEEKYFNPREIYKVETEKYIFTVEGYKVKFKYKKKTRIFISFLIVMITLCILENFTGIYFKYILSLELGNFNSININAILISYPAMVFLALVIYIVYKYVNKRKVNCEDN